MDKNNTREARIEIAAQESQNLVMNHEALFDQAVQMAYQHFDEPTDAHITGVYAVIVWQAQRGIEPCLMVH